MEAIIDVSRCQAAVPGQRFLNTPCLAVRTFSIYDYTLIVLPIQFERINRKQANWGAIQANRGAFQASNRLFSG